MEICGKNTEEKVLIIAELSANHGNDIDIAKRTIDAIKDSGADFVKIQTYTPDTITLDVDNEYFRINQGTLWDNRTLYDLYSEAYMPWKWTKELYQYCKKIDLPIFSSPFDFTAIDLLEKLQTPAYKIASFEITDIPLIEYAASKMKPIIISTGIADEEDIRIALNACYGVGNFNVALLKTTSAYPAKIEDANLLTMADYKKRFNVEYGLSDHTMGSIVPILSVGMGARIIEKHFILDKSIGGPDAEFSMCPTEFKSMVKQVRLAEKALGVVDYSLTEKKIKNRKFARSLFIAEDIKAGEVFNDKNVRSVRPSDGLSPRFLKDVIGKRATKDLKKGMPLKKIDVEGWKL